MTVDTIKRIQKDNNCSPIKAKKMLEKAELLFDTYNAKTIKELRLIVMKLIHLTL